MKLEGSNPQPSGLDRRAANCAIASQIIQCALNTKKM